MSLDFFTMKLHCGSHRLDNTIQPTVNDSVKARREDRVWVRLRYGLWLPGEMIALLLCRRYRQLLAKEHIHFVIPFGSLLRIQRCALTCTLYCRGRPGIKGIGCPGGSCTCTLGGSCDICRSVARVS